MIEEQLRSAFGSDTEFLAEIVPDELEHIAAIVGRPTNRVFTIGAAPPPMLAMQDFRG